MIINHLHQSGRLIGLDRDPQTAANTAAALQNYGDRVSVVHADYRNLAGVLRDAGIAVISLEKKGRWDTFSFFRRLVAEMRAVQPEVIHSFMGPPNLLAIALKRWLPNVRVVWGIRSSDMDLSRYDYTWKLTFALERWLSKRADIIAFLKTLK